MRMLLLIAIAFGLLFFGCTSQQPSPQPLPGSDRDSYGCIPSAGYQWCGALQKCIRPWEEKCEKQNGSAPPPVPDTNVTPLPPAVENETNQTPPVRAPGKEGEFCGGIAAFQCEEGLLCVLEGTYPDAGGTCQPKSSFGAAGDTCGGSTKPCEPGLQCITSGGIGSCTVPVASDEFHVCPSQRGEVCTAEYNPVCGRLAGGDTEVAGFREYGNACTACSKSSNAIGYYEGTCESRG